MPGRIFFSIFLSSFFYLLFSRSALALTIPNFPSCTNPQGQVIASFSDGTHGIPGDNNNHTGSDSVFKINDNQVLQCFCSGANGIQSNWLKVGILSASDISFWESQGFTYIPDGSAWGLDPTGYLVNNMNFSCGGTGGGTGGAGGNSNGSNNSSNNPIQEVLGATIFAGTGIFVKNLMNILFVFGNILIGAGLLSYAKEKKN